MYLKQICLGIIGLLFLAGLISAQMTWQQENEEGTLSLYDGKIPVITYRYGDQLKKGVPAQYLRACYIHPLYGLDGTILTADFPLDHFHHHGLFWTWPEVQVRGQNTQTWHPANLRQHFVRWIERETSEGSAALKAEIVWKLDAKEVVAREIISLRVHPIDDTGRKIDLTILLEPVGGPMTLKGASEGNKGYGGLCLRGAGMFKGGVLTTDTGIQEKDVVNTPFKWADLSTNNHGVTITVDPGHPGYPVSWLIRRGYAGILNPSWPGLEAVTLESGAPVTLEYQILVHHGTKK